jgi:hypothetical protein
MADFSEAIWRKSTHSMANGCVEVAFVDGQVGVRDSKDRNGPMLVFTAAEWEAFLAGVRERQFDRAPSSEQWPTI